MKHEEGKVEHRTRSAEPRTSNVDVTGPPKRTLPRTSRTSSSRCPSLITPRAAQIAHWLRSAFCGIGVLLRKSRERFFGTSTARNGKGCGKLLALWAGRPCYGGVGRARLPDPVVGVRQGQSGVGVDWT